MIRLLSLILSALVALSPLTANAAGEVVIVTAPWTVAVGDPVIVGGFAGIAAQGVSSGASLRLRREGVFTVAKATGTAWTTGDALYYAHGDAGLSKVSASKTFFGFAVASASSGATTGAIVLVPSGPITTIGDALTTLTATVTGFATALTTGTLTATSISSHSVDGIDVHVLASSVTTNTSDISSHGARLSALEALLTSGAVLRRPALILASDYPNVANTQAALQTLYTLAVPASVWSRAGVAIRVVATFTGATNANTKLPQVAYGGNYSTFGSTTASATRLVVETWIKSRGANSQFLDGSFSSGASVVSTGYQALTVSDGSSITVHSTCTAAGDVTLQSVLVEVYDDGGI